MLVASNFPFSHDVFYSYISLVRQNAASCDNGLTIRQNDGLVQIRNICRRHIKSSQREDIVTETVETLTEKEKMLIASIIFLFLTLPYVPLTLSQRTNFSLSKLKEVTEDNSKFVENGRKLPRRVENTVGNGEIAPYEQFLLFHSVFSKDLYCRHVKSWACLEKG